MAKPYQKDERGDEKFILPNAVKGEVSSLVLSLSKGPHKAKSLSNLKGLFYYVYFRLDHSVFGCSAPLFRIKIPISNNQITLIWNNGL